MKRCLTLLLAASGLLVADHLRLPAGEKGEPNTLIVTDANGKEHKLKTWKFAHGTRHLAFLAPADKDAPHVGLPRRHHNVVEAPQTTAEVDAP